MSQMAQEKEPASKLQMDKPTDFKFHVAYMAYSETWDENESEDTRNELNELISSLSSGKSSYEDFYANLSQFRKNRVEYRRELIQSVRKRDWRRSEQKTARDARHKR